MEIISAIIGMLGGLAMFLYGIEVMGDGLKNSSGAALKRVLEKVTGNVFLGVLTGTLVTAVIQSSTATIVLAVALIGAGVLNLRQAVSIVLGANIGTTVTAWITTLAFVDAGDNLFLWLFDTDTLAPIALAIGIVLVMFVKTKKAKTAGDICLGFGILFVGLMNMTGAVSSFKDSPVFMELLAGLADSPLLGILAGLVLTVIVQSSSATVAMLQALSVTGALNFSGVYPIIMGINIGTCIVTAFYCYVGGSSKDSKRTGLVHILFNTIGTVLFMLVMSLLENFRVFGADFWSMPASSVVIATFQTLFNVLTAAVLLPFTNQLVKASVKLVPDAAPAPKRHTELSTLSEKLYISPAMALNEAGKAVAYMGQLAKTNFVRGCEQLRHYDEDSAGIIDEDEEYLDAFANDSDHFLIGLSKYIESEQEDNRLDLLLQSVSNFERIGDYATNFVEFAQRLHEADAEFSDTAKQELQVISDAVQEIIDLTVQAFSSNSADIARQVEPLEETIDDMVLLLKERHTKRLKKGECSVDTGLIFMETLTYMERASDQCSSIAVLVLACGDAEIRRDHHEYLRKLHAATDPYYVAQLNNRKEQYILPLKNLKY